MGPVNDVQRSGFQSVVDSVKKHVIPHVKKTNELVSKVADAGRSVNGFVGNFVSTPSKLAKVLSGAKILSGLSVLFSIPDLVARIKKIFTAKTNAKQERAVLKSSIQAAGMVGQVGNFMQGLAAVGAISVKATSWFAKAAPYLFPFQVIGSLLNLHGTYKAYQFKKEMNKAITADTKEGSIIGACHFIMAQDGKRFGKHTAFSSPAMKEKAEAIMNRIQFGTVKEKAEGVKEGEKLLQLLKSRVRVTFALNILETLASVVAVAGSLVLIIAGMSNPVGAGILAATAVVGLGCYLYKLAALKSNPYAVTVPLHRRIAQGLQKTGKKINGFVKKNITDPVAKTAQKLFQKRQPA